MPQVELDQELCTYLQAHEKLSGESPSCLIRKLLKIGIPEKSNRTGGMRNGTDLERYLSILSDAFQRYPLTFPEIKNVQGSSRVYFSKDPNEILKAGNSTKPVRIPSSDWWAASNNSSDLKLRILSKVYKAIKCTHEDRSRWIAAFGQETPNDAGSFHDSEKDSFKI